MSYNFGQPQLPSTGREPNWDQLAIPLIGRESELARLKACLAHDRLVTLVGLGGTGKTRLAMEVTREVERQFSNGVYWIQLTHVDTVDAWYAMFANALGLDPTAVSTPQLLTERLSNKAILFVLDNFERMINHVAWLTQLIDQVNTPNSSIRWLVLSSEQLGIAHERVIELRGLSTLAPDPLNGQTLSAAEKLFLHYAGRAKPNFVMNEQERAHVRQICHIVEGHPLALELAAAWMSLLPTSFIVEQLQSNLDWLATSAQLTHTPHKSVRVVLDHFWSLMSPSEQRCLRQLAVFRDGFDREIAQEVTEVSLFFLAALVDRAFLTRHSNGRYRLHAMLHQYAESHLNEQPAEAHAIRQRHAHAMRKWLIRAGDIWAGRQEHEWLEYIDAEYSNLKQAIQWAIQNNSAELALQLVQLMSRFWQQRGYFAEGVHMIQSVLSISSVSSAANSVSHLQAALTIAELLLSAGELAGAITQAQDVLAHITDDVPEGFRLRSCALYIMSLAASQRGDYIAAQRDAEQSVAAARRISDSETLARALQSLGRTYETNGVYANAVALYQESLNLYESAQNLVGMAQIFNDLGLIYLAQKEFAAAARALNQAHAYHKRLGDRVNAACSQIYLGMTAFEQRQLAQAEEQIASALTVLSFTEAQEALVTAMLMLANVYLERGQDAMLYFVKGLDKSLKLALMPCMLVGLCGVARSYHKNGKTHFAIEIIGLILSHSASNSLHIQEANAVLSQVRRVVAHDEVDRRLASGRRRNLHQTVRQIVTDTTVS